MFNFKKTYFMSLKMFKNPTRASKNKDLAITIKVI